MGDNLLLNFGAKVSALMSNFICEITNCHSSVWHEISGYNKRFKKSRLRAKFVTHDIIGYEMIYSLTNDPALTA